jgi:hypothetical protein
MKLRKDVQLTLLNWIQLQLIVRNHQKIIEKIEIVVDKFLYL